MSGEVVSPPGLAALAAEQLALHAARNDAFGAHLFSPGAWDVMLALAAAARPLPLADLTQALASSARTLERWVAVLVADALVADHADGFALTPEGCGRLAAVLCGKQPD